jgi:hypothetical protein
MDTHMSKPLVTIENWAVVQRGAYAAYQALEPGNILTGKVFGHDRLADAKSIYTSAIISVNPDELVVETRNTFYVLGAVSEDYKNSEEYKSWDRERKAPAAA